MSSVLAGRADAQPFLERRFQVGRVGGPETLILVSEDNRATGSGEKLEVHRRGQLHRAFSIFLFDDRGQVLLQQRDKGKYHSGGLWANTCCGHPLVGERTRAAANRRLFEELGMTAILSFGFQARYRASLDNNLIENELVYAYGGRADDKPRPNPKEVMNTRFMSLDDLRADAERRPGLYAYWLRHYLNQHIDALSTMARRAQERASEGSSGA